MASTVNRWLEALMDHSQKWGMVWFGLIFWGSVLFATAQHFWPDGEKPYLELAFTETRESVRATVVDEATGNRLDPGDLRMQRRRD